MAKTKGIKIVADNRKAYHDYFIEEKYEAGIVLSGTEVKSIRAGKISLKESYVQVMNGEIFLIGCNISHYEQGNRFNKEPMRTRKLLMHRSEINRLFGVVKQKGLTLVPTKCYFSDGRVKIEVGLAKGKRDYDKRDSIAEREAKEKIARHIKDSARSSLT